MSTGQFVRVAAMTVALTMAPRLTQAQVTPYTTLAGFLDAVTAPRTDSYNDLPSLFIPSPLPRTVGLYSYVVSAPEGLFGVGSPGNMALSASTATDPVTFSTFSSTVRGIGGNFYNTNFDGDVAGGSIIVTYTEVGGVSGSFTIDNANANSFLGVVSAGGGFTELTITTVQPANAFLFPTVDNFVLGSTPAGMTVVPEPQTYVLMAVGLGLLCMCSRRRVLVAKIRER